MTRGTIRNGLHHLAWILWLAWRTTGAWQVFPKPPGRRIFVNGRQLLPGEKVWEAMARETHEEREGKEAPAGAEKERKSLCV